ncbi:flagellar protein FlgN [Neobacillus sp. LXY-1]|uniref:flagellar protein FlgN n=1 Tax=Neobacillus sp. LXY-1 TaxID=3379133 RepID=UPI003EDE86D8
MDPIKLIIQTLEAMVGAHSQLLDLAKEKRSVLVEGDINQLQNIIYRESSCTEEIQKLEEQRKALVKVYLEGKGIPEKDSTIEELLKVQENVEHRTVLSGLAKQLRSLIREISQLNESNQQLIQSSLSYTQFMIGMHVRKEPSIGYGPKSKNRYTNLLDAKI